jgi:hypothetical protein
MKGAAQLSGASSIWVLIPFVRTDLHHLPKRPHLLISSHWGLGYQQMKWEEGNTNTETIAIFYKLYCAFLHFSKMISDSILQPFKVQSLEIKS